MELINQHKHHSLIKNCIKITKENLTSSTGGVNLYLEKIHEFQSTLKNNEKEIVAFWNTIVLHGNSYSDKTLLELLEKSNDKHILDTVSLMAVERIEMGFINKNISPNVLKKINNHLLNNYSFTEKMHQKTHQYLDMLRCPFEPSKVRTHLDKSAIKPEYFQLFNYRNELRLIGLCCLTRIDYFTLKTSLKNIYHQYQTFKHKFKKYDLCDNPVFESTIDQSNFTLQVIDRGVDVIVEVCNKDEILSLNTVDKVTFFNWVNLFISNNINEEILIKKALYRVFLNQYDEEIMDSEYINLIIKNT